MIPQRHNEQYDPEPVELDFDPAVDGQTRARKVGVLDALMDVIFGGLALTASTDPDPFGVGYDIPEYGDDLNKFRERRELPF